MAKDQQLEPSPIVDTYGRLDDDKNHPHFEKGDRCFYRGQEREILGAKWEWAEYADDPQWEYTLSDYPRRVVGSALHQVQHLAKVIQQSGPVGGVGSCDPTNEGG